MTAAKTLNKTARKGVNLCRQIQIQQSIDIGKKMP
jgi:hypothetical protein